MLASTLKVFTALFFVTIKALDFTPNTVCGPRPIYSSGSVSRFIPYIDAAGNPDLVEDVAFDVSVTTSYSSQSYDIGLAMDTGSTGVAFGAAQLGLPLEYLQNYPTGSEFLSSSRVFYEGYWVSAVNLTFTAANVTAQIPILAVTKRSICGNFTNGSCEEASKTNITLWPTTIRYLGVGFGRWSSEQPGGTPDKVPLTNIAFVDGEPVPEGAMHAGYIINSTGVEVGLTANNTQGFVSTKLGLTPSSPAPRDWAQVDVSLAVDDSHWNNGSALFDTGIGQSYIRVDEETRSQLDKTVINDRGKNHSVLAPSSTVHMRVGTAPDFIAYYNVTVGDEDNIMRPYRGEFRIEAASNSAFLNTGRHIYGGFDASFDAECGWFGLKWKGEPGDEDGGLYSGLASDVGGEEGQPKSSYPFTEKGKALLAMAPWQLPLLSDRMRSVLFGFPEQHD